MADKRISEFLDGGLVQTGDEIAAVRGGDNYKVRVGSAAAYDAGQSGGELVILEEDSSGTVMLPAVSGEQLTGIPATPDPTVQVSADDTTSGYLEDKITGSASITVTKEIDSAGVESLRLDVAGAGDVVEITDGGTGATTAAGARTNLGLDNYAGFPIGMPFPVLDNITGVVAPSNAGDVKFIKLTASDAYNDGLLTSESVTGSAPLVVATAVIDYATSPIDGQTVNLLNTENRYLMPGTSSGSVANDQMQQITGSMSGAQDLLDGTGAFSQGGAGSNLRPGNGGNSTRGVNFDSANSPNARTGDHTNVKHQQATFYMRIA